MSTFYGKYRGKVVNNLDPEGRARLQVSVPAVLGDGDLAWALPCLPYAGPGVGFHLLPPVGAHLWVELEAGDAESPIWSGCFWSVGESPVTPADPTKKLIKTSEVTLELHDQGGGFVTIETAKGMRLELSPGGIEITNGSASITLKGQKVSVNDDALEVS